MSIKSTPPAALRRIATTATGFTLRGRATARLRGTSALEAAAFLHHALTLDCMRDKRCRMRALLESRARWCCTLLLAVGCQRSVSASEDGARCVEPLAASAPSPQVLPAICPREPSPRPHYEQLDVTFPDAAGAPRVRVEHAETQAAKARGLMYRATLAADAGMLFSWPDAAPRKFWMRDTCLSLDMIFLSTNNTIVGIVEHARPLSRTPVGVTCPAQRVLEVNGGWSRAHGVAPGQRVVFIR